MYIIGIVRGVNKNGVRTTVECNAFFFLFCKSGRMVLSLSSLRSVAAS